jgi:FAD/FMN-containing dehydrogenase
VITGLDLRLHPTPTQRITAIAGFDDLDALIDVGREFRDADGIAALELIDARASALTAKHMGVGPAVGVDTATQQRLWQVREAVADVLGIMVHH